LNGIPERNVDFIFLDPPYYNQRKDDYVPSKFTESLESFNEAIRTAFKNCHDALKPRGIMALIMGPQQWKLEEETGLTTASHSQIWLWNKNSLKYIGLFPHFRHSNLLVTMLIEPRNSSRCLMLYGI
jgi:DNA modification methylase